MKTVHPRRSSAREANLVRQTDKHFLCKPCFTHFHWQLTFRNRGYFGTRARGDIVLHTPLPLPLSDLPGENLFKFNFPRFGTDSGHLFPRNARIDV